MSYVVLARKWRPQRFEDLVGQEHVARTLANAIARGRVAHAFLFTGVRGVGKTTSARILAKTLNCMGPPGTPALAAPPTTPCLECAACREIAAGVDLDVQEIDGASYNGVNEVRSLQDQLPYRPARDRYKIFVVDEVHMLSNAAWNAFLKTLEEPPPHVKFIFATTEAHRVPVTILSRVQRFDFKLIPASLVLGRLREVLAGEGIEADDGALAILAREAAGSMRDAMSLLDQVIAWGGDRLVEQDVARVLGVASRGALLDLARALCGGDAGACLRTVAALADQGHDMPRLARDVLALLRDLTVARVAPEAEDLLDLPPEEATAVRALAQTLPTEELMRLHHGFSAGFDDVVRGHAPRAGLEMLLVRLARRPPLLPVDDLVSRLAALERSLRGVPQGGPPGTPGPGSRPAERPQARETRSAPAGKSASPRDEPPPAQAAAPPPVTPAAEAPRAPAPASGATLPDAWGLVVGEVRRHDPGLAARLDHAVPQEVSGDLLVVAWAPTLPFLEDVRSPEARATLLAAAAAVLGKTPKLEHRVDAVASSAEATLSSERARERAERQRRRRAELLDHPLVRDVLRELPARVVEVRLFEE